ncbi:type II toxin-antitoxin system VapC family toxin [Jiella marina]|uniref:type II toxin-antitoxin system VapC family toxin n=1 Tax=Jiella sp. LLJ827 TaxID=2917712 RepID=UPI00350E4C1C
MNLLVDTHLVLWAAGAPDRLSAEAHSLLADDENNLYFSAASLWEITIKAGLGRDDFVVDPRLLRAGLLDNGWRELPITSEHVVSTGALPLIHKDPFDRLLIAQASSEGFLLLTSDKMVSRYTGPIRKVWCKPTRGFMPGIGVAWARQER